MFPHRKCALWIKLNAMPSRPGVLFFMLGALALSGSVQREVTYAYASTDGAAGRSNRRQGRPRARMCSWPDFPQARSRTQGIPGRRSRRFQTPEPCHRLIEQAAFRGLPCPRILSGKSRLAGRRG